MADADTDSKPANQNELVADIDRTRSDLARTIDAISDRVSPKKNVQRVVDQVRERLPAGRLPFGIGDRGVAERDFLACLLVGPDREPVPGIAGGHSRTIGPAGPISGTACPPGRDSFVVDTRG